MLPIKSKKPLTLVFPLDKSKNKILLGFKKRGFGMNKFNGFGGKLEAGETVLQAAHRELTEESMIKAQDMKKIGINFFTFEDDPVGLEVHVYFVTDYLGTPTETEEMRPEWFDYDTIPYPKMWTDDKQWLPIALEGNYFLGEFHFAKDQTTILSQNLSVVTDPPIEFNLDQRTL
ncbi:NUDIX hydrolase domain-like protein [Halteromyces radiatus]|uniref:NUDIX hydrolase domain-like protein n=1 Tax=Halteromyces radiatus TaxID=101107 RepID=UPI00221F4772|nr:NUDIX hydrolase domain-like protein [Halteromyces radiatus]KAI8097225.1 NUDIX hydrolase domain-like protein [Halteromyces radiatus]